jgi:hypothetical protein
MLWCCGSGVLNIQAINDLIVWQRIQYDFQYHKIEFHADLPVLVLSEGPSIFTVCSAHRHYACRWESIDADIVCVCVCV